jgi:uncharacterized membrane protein YozB (DUF420 family)
MLAIQHTHSGLRWVILLLLLVAIVRAFARKNSGLYEKSDKMINLFTMISLHIQLVLGLILYISDLGTKIRFEGFMANPQSRILGMEHALLMIIAITVVTIGRSKAEKKITDPRKKHAKIATFYTIGLLLILAGIPWPFRNIGTGWF